jgi:uncharacterized protein (UPF0248 family)
MFNGEIDFDTHTMKVLLCTSTYTPNIDTHRYRSSITNEVTGSGYTAGGATLGSKAVTYATGTNTLTLDAADVTWDPSTITARYAVVYRDTGTSSTSPLLMLIDFGANVSSDNGPFDIEWDAAGIVTAVAA